MRSRMKFIMLAVASAMFLFAGCSGPQVRSSSPEDNPQHHYLTGMTALENGKVALAQEKFERAIYLDERYAKAYAGLAIVSAEKVRELTDAGFRQVETDRIFENLKKAEKFADKTDDEFEYYIAKIRVHTLIKNKDWLDESEDAFKAGGKLKVDERALTYYQGTEALTYFIGVADLEGVEFQKARDRFADVLNAKREGKWHEKADRAWKKTDKIVRAMSGITVGDVAKKLAVKDAVSRADLAALLIDEMKLEKLFAGRIPVASHVTGMKAEFTPADVVTHPFKEEILTMMKWNVRGLEPKFDETTQAYLFKPVDSVSRGEMAFIMEDVLIKLTNDEKIATAYFGQEKSPFPDVRNTSLFYNAVMNMTTRGIMEGELSGEFRVNDPIDGAEALLAVRVLKQRINIY
jgi:phage antirepressor YoqD-like protein